MSFTLQSHRLILKALLWGAMGICTQALAQQEHLAHAGMAASSKPSSVCLSSGLECANAATPFLTSNGKLFLAWTAGGVVSVAQSMDLGKTFSPAIKIAEHGKALDTGSDARPQIVSDQRGNVFVAYAFFKDASWNAQINTAQSSDAGATFTAPHSLVQDSASQRFPMALIKPDNSIFMTWIDKRVVAAAKQKGVSRLGASIAYATSTDGGRTFQAESIANENTCECCRIGAGLDPQSQAVLAYRAIFPGGIRDQASQVIGSKGAGQVRRIADDDWKTDVCPHHGPSIAVSSTGKFHVTWYTQGSKRAGVFYANSSNQGQTYSKPARVGSEDANVSRPYLLTLGRQIWLAWKEYDGNHSTIYIKQSNDDGLTWSEPKALAKTTGYSDHPLLVKQEKEVFLSWLTRSDGYQLIKVGQMQ